MYYARIPCNLREFTIEIYKALNRITELGSILIELIDNREASITYQI